jgi:hypothetical protein
MRVRCVVDDRISSLLFVEKVPWRDGVVVQVPAVPCTDEDLAALTKDARAAGFAACRTRPVDRPLPQNALALARAQATP